MFDSINDNRATLASAVPGSKLTSTPGEEVNSSGLNGCDECSDDYENDGSKVLVFFTECVMLGVCRGWRQSGFLLLAPFFCSTALRPTG